jgi:hypothetical protein
LSQQGRFFLPRKGVPNHPIGLGAAQKGRTQQFPQKAGYSTIIYVEVQISWGVNNFFYSIYAQLINQLLKHVEDE